jgi:hypothetical protein
MYFVVFLALVPLHSPERDFTLPGLMQRRRVAYRRVSVGELVPSLL